MTIHQADVLINSYWQQGLISREEAGAVHAAVRQGTWLGSKLTAANRAAFLRSKFGMGA